MQYLCEYHKLSAMACPITAEQLWQMAFEAGNMAIEQQQWQDACLGFGSSFDLACIMVERHLSELSAIRVQWRLQQSCNKLILALRNSGRNTDADKYVSWVNFWMPGPDDNLSTRRYAIH